MDSALEAWTAGRSRESEACSGAGSSSEQRALGGILRGKGKRRGFAGGSDGLGSWKAQKRLATSKAKINTDSPGSPQISILNHEHFPIIKEKQKNDP